MKIEADGEEKIAVTLSERDMRDFDITYDEMDYSNIETRRVIWTILDEAKKILGKSINLDNRLLIQVSPVSDGGCVMHFSQLGEVCDHRKRRLIIKKEWQPVVFKAFDCNALIDVLSLREIDSDLFDSSEIYVLGKDYYAIFLPNISQTEKLSTVLCEYGTVTLSNKRLLAEIYESGKALKLSTADFVSSAPNT